MDSYSKFSYQNVRIISASLWGFVQELSDSLRLYISRADLGEEFLVMML